MRRPTKQDILGDWSVTTWLTAIAYMVAGMFLLTVLVELLPQQ